MPYVHDEGGDPLSHPRQVPVALLARCRLQQSACVFIRDQGCNRVSRHSGAHARQCCEGADATAQILHGKVRFRLFSLDLRCVDALPL
jgi:hypothetical protein